MCLISNVTWAVFLVILVVRAGSVLVAHRKGRLIVRKCVEAEQSRKDWEHPVVFGQKRVKRGAGQSDTAKTLSVHPFWDRKAPETPVFAIAHKYL